jgi:hypothetical protein
MRMRSEHRLGLAALCVSVAVPVFIAGCGEVVRSSQSITGPTPQGGPQSYFAAAVAGGYHGGSVSDSEYLASYTFDDSANTFAQLSYTFTSGDQKGPQLNYSGSWSALSRGLRNLGITYSNGQYGDSSAPGVGINYSPPLTGNWAFELAGQAGGFVNLKGMPFVPMVATQSCPSFSQASTYQFITIPTYIGTNLAGPNGGIQNWDPQHDTAYGLASVSTSGNTVEFKNIQQFTSAGTQVSDYPDVPGDPAAITSIAGSCSPTFYGNTISVPGDVLVTLPGPGETITSSAIVGVGPTGLLVENNGQTQNSVSNASFTGYQPFLGSGTGAIGLPQPSSAADVQALSGAQYLGVIYGGGSGASDWTSRIASFGFPNAPTACPSGNFQAPIFGGDFPNNDPTQSPASTSSGFGNCDIVIDLGQQDSSRNGLFPNATIYLSQVFTGNATAGTYSFPATAIAGQLNGKYAIFVIGVDNTGTPSQAWGVYLFQSN